MTIGFLPLVLVRINVNILIRGVNTTNLIMHMHPLPDFFTHFTNNYINGHFSPSCGMFLKDRLSFEQIPQLKVTTVVGMMQLVHSTFKFGILFKF